MGEYGKVYAVRSVDLSSWLENSRKEISPATLPAVAEGNPQFFKFVSHKCRHQGKVSKGEIQLLGLDQWL